MRELVVKRLVKLKWVYKRVYITFPGDKQDSDEAWRKYLNTLGDEDLVDLLIDLTLAQYDLMRDV